MKKRNKVILAGMVIAGAAAVPTVAAAGGDVDMPITGADLDQATAAALAYTGDGRVTGTEVGDEESFYEVEVTLSDGSQVDVQLDEQFNVVGSEADGKGEDQSAGD
ncbi:MAG: hypothetical protein OEM81_04770 [Acidimicrobiia bacterium]|nr:hypothetical protein [Acidimicrobiia bacterium]